MLKYIPMTNIWDMEVDCVIVTVNCEGIMGAGIALQCKEQYPDVYGSYRFACKEGMIKPGKLYFLRRGNEAGLICLFPTKDEVRRDSTYGIVAAGLKTLKDRLMTDNGQGRIKKIAIPPLGCGLGNLEWSKVKELYELHLADCSQEIILIEP